jgi:hypothetical protein
MNWPTRSYVRSGLEPDQINALDMMLTAGIAMLVIALLLSQAPVLQAKARLTELITASAMHKIELVIDAAQTGNFGVPRATDQAGVAVEDELALRRQGAAPSAHKPRQGTSPQESFVPKNHDEIAGGFTYEARDGRLLVTGVALSERFELPFSLAVPAQGPIGNVLWVCADAPLPPGWIASRRPEGTRMRSDLLFHMCRTPAGVRT